MASQLNSQVALWEKRADEEKQKQKINPFCNWEGVSGGQMKLSKDDPNYGRPVQGSLTELRGKQAGEHISREVIELCHNIADLGERHSDGTYTISFGDLFEAYTIISNKVVGMLMRARKHKLLTFKGEMLYQRRDEGIIITLLRIPEG